MIANLTVAIIPAAHTGPIKLHRLVDKLLLDKIQKSRGFLFDVKMKLGWFFFFSPSVFKKSSNGLDWTPWWVVSSPCVVCLTPLI